MKPMLMSTKYKLIKQTLSLKYQYDKHPLLGIPTLALCLALTSASLNRIYLDSTVYGLVSWVVAMVFLAIGSYAAYYTAYPLSERSNKNPFMFQLVVYIVISFVFAYNTLYMNPYHA